MTTLEPISEGQVQHTGIGVRADIGASSVAAGTPPINGLAKRGLYHEAY